MKKNTDYELLSAYIDGELSPEEIKKLEERISYTPQLQKKLMELKRLKELTKSSIKKIDEAPYFETRLISHLEEKPFRIQVKRLLPVTGIIVLTFAVMALLKFNPGFFDDIVEEQKATLAGFYKENLQPLLYAGDLTNEDIFNFAFYNRLPLDYEKTRYLQLGSDTAGSEFFEITTSDIVTDEDNFENFVNALNLNDNQKKQFDSIMHNYAEEILTQVLVNDRNTVAINPNLWNFRKAIAADVMKFASLTAKTTVNTLGEVMPFIYNVEPPTVERMVHTVKTSKDNEYIFITPDTFFVDKYEFDKEAFKRDMQKVKEDMQRVKKDMKITEKELKKNLREYDLNQPKHLSVYVLDSTLARLEKDLRGNKNIKIHIDSNFLRVHLDKIEIPHIEMPDIDSLEALINEATKQVQNFSFSIPGSKKNKKFKYDLEIFPSDSINSFKFDIQIPGADSLRRIEIQPFNWVYPDSIDSWFNIFKDDSSFVINQKELEKRMRRFEQEMKRFKEDMERMKKELRKDSVKVQVKKQVET